MVAALFCGLIGAIAAWLCRQTGTPSNALGPVILALFCCCIAAAATGLLFATFLHPFLATLAASIVLSLPLFVELLGRSGSWQLFPVAWMVHFLLGFQLQPPGKEIWEIAATALCQIAVFWMAAAAIFARRDVTISPE
jgi:ribose/xylose/arabinose/galactoside ABC-type transport system permease subunit